MRYIEDIEEFYTNLISAWSIWNFIMFLLLWYCCDCSYFSFVWFYSSFAHAYCCRRFIYLFIYLLRFCPFAVLKVSCDSYLGFVFLYFSSHLFIYLFIYFWPETRKGRGRRFEKLKSLCRQQFYIHVVLRKIIKGLKYDAPPMLWRIHETLILF